MTVLSLRRSEMSQLRMALVMVIQICVKLIIIIYFYILIFAEYNYDIGM